MHSIDEHLTEIYVFIDDYFKAHPQRAHWRQSNNAAPDFTDAEVMTIALMQGYFGGATLRRTYALVKGYWGASEQKVALSVWATNILSMYPGPMSDETKARLRWVSLYLETKDAGLVCRRCGISRPTLRSVEALGRAGERLRAEIEDPVGVTQARRLG